MPEAINSELIQGATDFHGHWCPGLAIGIRAAEWALQEMGRSGDEDIVAVVETDMCGVDAIQYLTGCTFGKGNLIHKDYGKNAFTFYRRSDGKAARIVARPGIFGEGHEALGRLHRKMQTDGLTEKEEADWKQIRAMASKRVMEARLADLFEVKEPSGPPPKQARILSSLPCDSCGEAVMESRTRRIHEQTLCLPCFEEMEKRY
ncbi:MAG: TraR/DksA C4-type zinc finger protein [Proteobacteria bacterium]|nr:TraR/DksA C4-type zinc finger protein [Pseudomonadota bacterium]